MGPCQVFNRDMKQWCQLDAATAIQRLGSDITDGLTVAEAARRLQGQGPNELINLELKDPWRICGSRCQPPW
jgi:Ca2+-transporting ATPase